VSPRRRRRIADTGKAEKTAVRLAPPDGAPEEHGVFAEREYWRNLKRKAAMQPVR
jgi:hypothetical protein